MKTQLRNAVLALAMLLPLTMNGQNNNAGHEMPQRKSITFPASDIQYWVGTGSNSAVVIIGWDDNPSGNNTFGSVSKCLSVSFEITRYNSS